MPFLSTTAIRTSFRLVLVASILIIFTSGNGYAFSLLSWVPSEGDFALGEWQGGVIGGYEWEDQQTTTGNNTTTVLRNRFDEDVFLRNNAFYLIDPRLLSGSAGVNLDFYQESDKYNGANKHQDGTLIGFDVNTTILGQMPYTGLLFAHRNENNTDTDFGGTTYSLNQSFGGMATLRQDSFLRESFPYFAADVYARQEEADQSTTQFGQTFTVNETRNIGGFDAEKGFQTADLDVTYQLVDDSYTGSTPAYSFITQWASCNYSLDFGPTLNRRWDSLISYLTRSGNGVDESFLYADEKLRIDHFKNLSTTTEYLLTDTDTQGQQDVDNSLMYQVQYRPYRNLTNTLTLQDLTRRSRRQATRTSSPWRVIPTTPTRFPGAAASFSAAMGATKSIKRTSADRSRSSMRSTPHRPFSAPGSDSPSAPRLLLLRPSSCTTPLTEEES